MKTQQIINYNADQNSMTVGADREGFFTTTATEFLGFVQGGYSCSIEFSDEVRDEMASILANGKAAERVLSIVSGF